MTDELEVIAGLSPEQRVERAKAVLLEAEYWRLILGDLRDVGRGARDVAAAIVTSTESAVALVPQLDAGRLTHVEVVVVENRKALDALTEVSAGLDRLADLAEGRTKAVEPIVAALLRAAGVEPGDAAESEAP
jgi:hypothetical protein